MVCISFCCSDNENLNFLCILLRKKMKPGSIILTTEFSLPLEGFVEPLEDDEQMPSGNFEFELIEKVDGWCWLMGGQSTVYIHRVLQSLWEDGVGKRRKPVLSVRKQARQIIEAMEAGELTDTKKFVRDVYNAMVFHGYLEKTK